MFQIALYAVVGAAGSGCVVMLSEELPIERRARGQSFGGLAAAVGGGLCVFLMPIFDAYGISWRWMFVISAAGVAMLPAMARLLPEELGAGKFPTRRESIPGRVSTTCFSRSTASDRSR